MNSNINDEYKKMLTDMDANMSNPDDIEYAKNKLYELSMLFLDEMQQISDGYNDKINAILQNQQVLDGKIKKLQDQVTNIKSDMYDFDDIEDSETFEFEITCPYCNHNFIVDVGEEKKEVQCPECQNLIELDWDGLEEDGYCGGSCSHCHGCEDDCDEDDDEDDM